MTPRGGTDATIFFLSLFYKILKILHCVLSLRGSKVAVTQSVDNHWWRWSADRAHPASSFYFGEESKHTTCVVWQVPRSSGVDWKFSQTISIVKQANRWTWPCSDYDLAHYSIYRHLSLVTFKLEKKERNKIFQSKNFAIKNVTFAHKVKRNKRGNRKKNLLKHKMKKKKKSQLLR